MGATIITNRKAGIIRHTDGQHSLVLFEESYDSNTFPRQTRWRASCVGQWADVVRRIFHDADSVEDGILACIDGAGRYMKADAFLQSWQEMIASPVPLDDAQAVLGVIPVSGIFPSDPSPRQHAIRVLRAYGEVALAEAVEAGREVGYDPATLHGELLAALFGFQSPVHPSYSGLKPGSGGAVTVPAPKPRVRKPVPDFSILWLPTGDTVPFRYAFARVRRGKCHRLMVDGCLRRAAYHAAGDAEAVYPGAGAEWLAAFHDEWERRTPIRDEACITITMNVSEYECERRASVISMLKKRYGLDGTASTFATVLAKDFARLISGDFDEGADRYEIRQDDGIFLLSEFFSPGWGIASSRAA